MIEKHLTKCQCIEIYNRLIDRVYRLFAGGTQYGVDWPTLYVCYPTIAKVIIRLKNKIMKQKIYVGIKSDLTREIFKSRSKPKQAFYPQYTCVIGPFRTVRGAKFMAKYGKDNPHCQCVSDAEKLAKRNDK